MHSIMTHLQPHTHFPKALHLDNPTQILRPQILNLNMCTYTDTQSLGYLLTHYSENPQILSRCTPTLSQVLFLSDTITLKHTHPKYRLIQIHLPSCIYITIQSHPNRDVYAWGNTYTFIRVPPITNLIQTHPYIQIHHLYEIQINPNSHTDTLIFSDTFPTQIYSNTIKTIQIHK